MRRGSGSWPSWGRRRVSIRSITPAASRRRNRSSSDSAAAAAAMVSAASPSATTGSGWTTARLSIHGSRGRTQTMRSGGTPLASSHTIPSVAVLPEPTITKLLGAVGQPGELVDGDDPDVVGNAERRGRRRGDRRRQVRGVDDPASHVDLHGLARHPGRDEMGRAVGVVLAPPEERDAPRAEEAAMQDVVVVRLDLRLTRPFLKPRLRPAQLHGAAARARSMRRRRTPTPDAAGRTDTRPASARPPRGDGRPA